MQRAVPGALPPLPQFWSIPPYLVHCAVFTSPTLGLPSPRRVEHWRPSKAAIIWSAVGLAVVAILAFGLVFGLPSGSGGGGAAPADVQKTEVVVPSGCQAMASGEPNHAQRQPPLALGAAAAAAPAAAPAPHRPLAAPSRPPPRPPPRRAPARLQASTGSG
jgi:hypothetical protein